MDSQHNSKDRQPRSVDERLDRLEEIIGQIPPDRQKAMMRMLNAGTLADDLRKAIVESGLTTYAIGKQCGLDQIAIDRFMRGERDIRVATASKICEVLGYGLGKLEPKPSKPVKKKSVKKKKPSQ